MNAASLRGGCFALSEFFVWRNPESLLVLSKHHIGEVGTERFLSTGGDQEQMVQEALVASTFARCLCSIGYPVMIRMTEIGTRLKDFELRSNNQLLEFEVTRALEPGTKPREAWSNGNRPEIPPRAFSGEQIDPEWLADSIQKKTAKFRASNLSERRHLLVYLDIMGGSPDLKRVASFCQEDDALWESVWVISGIPHGGGISCLFNDSKFVWPTARWLSWVDAKPGGHYGGFDIYLQ